MLQKKNKYAIAVAGADGVVGREMLEILEERNFPVSELILLGPGDSEGERLEFRGKTVTVKKLAQGSFPGIDIAFFAVDAGLSREYVPAAVGSGAVVIDLSSAFSMDPAVPLVVPEINADMIRGHKGIVASPGSPTVALVVALKPLHDAGRIRRIVVTAFQSVSGTGKNGMDELAQQTVALLNFRDVETGVYPHQIAFNCLPHTGAFTENGSSREEMKMRDETRRILRDDSLRLTATTVRVPVFRCDSEAVNIETEKKIPANEARALLSAAPGLIVYDDPQKNIYPLAVDVAGKDETYVGRIREDESIANGLNLWIVSDNLRKGAALNAVQIAELLVK